MISLRSITEDNFSAVIAMKRPEGEGFVSSVAYSLSQAWLYREAGDVFPAAIYAGEEPVGFVMLDADFEERVLVLWRILLPEEHCGKGYGTQAIEKIIEYAKESGKFDAMILDYHPDNHRAEHVYRKLGFAPTGEVERGEIVMRKELI